MNWESLIAERIAAHRDTYAPQRIEDAGKRNAARNQKRWRENNPDKVRTIYDRERKQKWWRLKHPNPRPVGRPKKEAA